MLIPVPLELVRLIFGSDDEGDRRSARIELLVTTIAYLLMLLVGGVLLVFFASHVRMAAQGRTTLDDSLIQEEEQSAGTMIVNPFDQGSAMKNLRQVLGHNVLFWILPIPVDPPMPYLPPKVKNG